MPRALIGRIGPTSWIVLAFVGAILVAGTDPAAGSDASRMRAQPAELAWGGAYGGGIWLWRSGHRSLLTNRDETVDGLALAGQTLWWVENGGTDDVYAAAIQPEGSTAVLSEKRAIVHVSTPDLIDDLALAPGSVYWLTTPPGPDVIGREVIGRANRDGTNVKPALIRAGGATAIAVASGYVYWAGNGIVGRARLDGSDADPRFLTGLPEGNPTSIAVDGSFLYWTGGDNGVPAIGRVRLDGRGRKIGFIHTSREIYGLAIGDGELYWGGYGSAVGQATLGGSHVNVGFLRQPMVDGVMRVAVGPQ